MESKSMKRLILGMVILTSTSSYAGLMNDTSIWALKSQIYTQSEFGSAVSYSYFFDSGVLDTGATTAPSIVGGLMTETMTGEVDHWSYSELYNTKADMDQEWPNGAYDITSNGLAGSVEVGVGVSPAYADAYPSSIPSLQSVTDSNFIDETLVVPLGTEPISFDWNAPGAGVTDVLLFLYDSDFQTIFYGSYASDAQSTGMIDFPFASPGAYGGELLFLNKTAHQVIAGVDVYAGFYHGTILSIDVIPEPAAYAFGCGLVALFALIVKRRVRD